MHVAILAGGLGSRLGPLTVSLPKPLLPVGPRAILEIILLQLADQGFTHVSLCTGYLSHLIRGVVGDGNAYGLEVSYTQENEPTGTAGALRDVTTGDGPLLVMNGDLLTRFAFSRIVEDHLAANCAATVVVTNRQTTLDYGIVTFGPDRMLQDWSEKPTMSHHVSTGVYVLSADALSLIPPQGRYDMPELLDAIRASGRSVRCLETAEYWQDIGRLEDYARACEDVEDDPSLFIPPGRK
jgi:NDP-sugar pyrophosphorylase family protein